MGVNDNGSNLIIAVGDVGVISYRGKTILSFRKEG